MRSIFVTCVFLIHFGITVRNVKSNPLNDLEKTFTKLNKRCSRIMSVRKKEHLRHVDDDFKTEAFSKKETLERLREEYQERLNKSEKYHKMYLERQTVTQDLEERLKECEHLYLITENEVATLNIKNNRLNCVLTQLEEVNDNHKTNIESKDKLIQQLQAQLEQSKTNIHGVEREIKVSLSTIAWIVLFAVLFTMLLWFFTDFFEVHNILPDWFLFDNNAETIDIGSLYRMMIEYKRKISIAIEHVARRINQSDIMENRTLNPDPNVNMNLPEIRQQLDDLVRRISILKQNVNEMNIEIRQRLDGLENRPLILDPNVDIVDRPEQEIRQQTVTSDSYWREITGIVALVTAAPVAGIILRSMFR